jgi:hypothetical protein
MCGRTKISVVHGVAAKTNADQSEVQQQYRVAQAGLQANAQHILSCV